MLSTLDIDFPARPRLDGSEIGRNPTKS